MADVTFREATRRKIVWAALLAGGAVLTLFAAAMHFQAKDLARYNVPPFIRYQVQSSIRQVGFYAADVFWSRDGGAGCRGDRYAAHFPWWGACLYRMSARADNDSDVRDVVFDA